MRALPFLLAALLLAPIALARAPEEGYRAQARVLLGDLDAVVLRAKVATVEHAFGDLDARATAHVMRRGEQRVSLVGVELAGLQPPRALARTHDTLAQAVAWYADALSLLESCYRRGDDASCEAAFVRLGWALAYRDAAALALR